MDVSKVSSSLPNLYSNKNRQLEGRNKQLNDPEVHFQRQEAYQRAYEKFEKIEKTDLSLYKQVEQFPEQNRLNQLFAISIRV
jgi:hypothetical protein